MIYYDIILLYSYYDTWKMIRIMYYIRIIQEDIVTLPVGIREGIIRGNGYVLWPYRYSQLVTQQRRCVKLGSVGAGTVYKSPYVHHNVNNNNNNNNNFFLFAPQKKT